MMVSTKSIVPEVAEIVMVSSVAEEVVVERMEVIVVVVVSEEVIVDTEAVVVAHLEAEELLARADQMNLKSPKSGLAGKFTSPRPFCLQITQRHLHRRLDFSCHEWTCS
jgi:hypothetical protein